MAKESPIKRSVVRLPEGGQLGLFGSKELQGIERHAERSGKVIFNQGSVEDLFIGSVRVEEHLRVTGEREAFVVREVLSEMDFRELESVTALGDVARIRRARCWDWCSMG